MKSDIPKPLLKINDVPILEPVIQHALDLGVQEVVVVISQFTEAVEAQVTALSPKVHCVTTEPLGTGACAAVGVLAIQNPKIDQVLIVAADDSYFYSSTLLKQLVATRNRHKSVISVGVLPKSVKRGWAAVVSHDNLVTKFLPAGSTQDDGTGYLAILYAGDRTWLSQQLPTLQPDESLEVPLHNIIDSALKAKLPVSTITIPRNQWLSINTPEELDAARKRAVL